MSDIAVSLEGSVVFDIDLKFTAGGKPWARTRVACKKRVRDASTGAWVDGDTTFLTVVCWGRQAENLAESVRVGDTITVSGTLAQREWVGETGEKRTDYQVNADSIGVSLLWNVARTPKALEDMAPAPTVEVEAGPFPF